MRDLKSLQNRMYDLCIIGGGINGAALANLAGGSNLKVLLLEKGDFASGTSSKSTKLMHGGIRYLENLEFGLVREALHERFIQTKIAPHLVKPIPFLIPVYKNDPRPLWKMKCGVWLYDFLSGKYALGKHRSFNAEQTLVLEPGLRSEDLVGSVLYYDAQMDDARLCLENILSARQTGAHVLNYAEVISFIKENGRAVGVKGRDGKSKQSFEVRAKKIVVCAGPWSDELMHQDNAHAKEMVRVTKGVHLVYKGQLIKHAILIQSRDDRRIFFIIPWQGNSMIGTTDTDYQGSRDRVEVLEEDIEYLLSESQRIFPTVTFERKHLLTTFAGLRPLAHEPGQPSKVSRRHVIEESFSGVTYVMGGKYTTYRAIALDVLRKLGIKKSEKTFPLPALPPNGGGTKSIPSSNGGGSKGIPSPNGGGLGRGTVVLSFSVYGGGEIKEDLHEISREYDIDPEIVLYLRQKYGTRYLDVLKLTQSDKSLKERICTCSNVIKAQLIYSRDVELAMTVADVIERRLGLQFVECASLQCRRVIEDFMNRP